MRKFSNSYVSQLKEIESLFHLLCCIQSLDPTLFTGRIEESKKIKSKFTKSYQNQ